MGRSTKDFSLSFSNTQCNCFSDEFSSLTHVNKLNFSTLVEDRYLDNFVLDVTILKFLQDCQGSKALYLNMYGIPRKKISNRRSRGRKGSMGNVHDWMKDRKGSLGNVYDWRSLTKGLKDVNKKCERLATDWLDVSNRRV